MKFSAPQAIAAMGSLWLGQQQGRQFKQQQDQQEQQRALALLPHLMQMEQAQRDQELEPYRFAASLQGQTPESQQAAVQALLQKTQVQSAQPHIGPSDWISQAHRAYPHAQFPQGTPPIAPPGWHAPEALPTPQSSGPTVPTPVFQAPGEAEATAGISRDLQGIMNDAQNNGDVETANAARDLYVKLARKVVTPEQASQAISALQSQGKVTATQDKQGEAPFLRLQKLHDELRVKPEFRGQVQALLGKYASAPPIGPARRTFLQGLSKDVTALEGQDYLSLPPDDEQRLQNAKATTQLRVQSAFNQLLTGIPKAKNPVAARDLAGRLWQISQSPEGRDAGLEIPADLNPTPLNGESQYETDARIMAGLASRLTDSDSDQKAAKDMRKQSLGVLEKLLAGGKLDEAGTGRVLGQIERVLREGGGDVDISDLKLSKLTPAQQEQVNQFNQRYNLDLRRADQTQKDQDRRYKLSVDQEKREIDKWEIEKKAKLQKARGPEYTKQEETQIKDAQSQRGIAAKLIETIQGKKFRLESDDSALADAKKKYDQMNRFLASKGATAPPETQGPPNPAAATPGASPHPAAAPTTDVRSMVIDNLRRFQTLHHRTPTEAERNEISRLTRSRAGVP